ADRGEARGALRPVGAQQRLEASGKGYSPRVHSSVHASDTSSVLADGRRSAACKSVVRAPHHAARVAANLPVPIHGIAFRPTGLSFDMAGAKPGKGGSST